MGYHPRIECKKIASFQTTRARRSELWFVNNKALEADILSYAAKYSTRYKVKLYAFAIEGNHIQFPALFPKANRADFMRDLNSMVAKAVAKRQVNFSGGKLWARRYSCEYMPCDSDIEDQFFYTVLQPVQDGLVDRISDYPGYNCFEDAISGRSRRFKMVKWKEYHDAKRWNKKVSIEKFTEIFELSFARLPSYKHLSKAAYMKYMREELAKRTKQIIDARKGKPSVGPAALRRVKPGAIPHHTKTSTITDHRPRIMCKDKVNCKKGYDWYFTRYFKYREASKEYRSGNLDVVFPEGTYKPPLFTVAYPHKMIGLD
jgi:REP element-mobilizing transposase RayT